MTLEPRARAAAGLPPASFDSLLEGLAAFAAADGATELAGLDDIVCALPADGGAATGAAGAARHTAIDVHVGALDAGDVAEAERLRAAVEAHSHPRAESSAARGVGVGGGGRRLSCNVHVHAGGDHNLVKGMRDAGELERLIRALVALPDERTEDGGRHDALPEDFLGFADCPDF